MLRLINSTRMCEKYVILNKIGSQVSQIRVQQIFSTLKKFVQNFKKSQQKISYVLNTKFVCEYRTVVTEIISDALGSRFLGKRNHV